MRILLLSPQPFFQVRGTPLNIRNLAETLGAAGHQVDLLCYPFGENLNLPGVRILRSPRIPGIRSVKVGPSLAKIPLDALMALEAWLRILRTRYDVIHAVEESVFFASPVARMRQIPLLYDMDSLISDQLAYSGFLTWKPLLHLIVALERRALRRSVRVLTVCRSLTDSARALAPEAEFYQIEDAPLQEEFHPDAEGAEQIRTEWQLGNRPCIVYTGNFERYQGLDLLVESMVPLRERHPDAVAVLVGGESRHIEALQQKIMDLGVEDQVVCTGPMPMARMAACMTLASVLAAPRTRGTNTALKIYGYMQTGKPVVATRLETHTQVLDDSCAWLTGVTPTEFAAGIAEALDNPEEASRRGLTAQERVGRDFSLTRFRRQVLDLYAGLESEPAC